jgi:hypothetical protein
MKRRAVVTIVTQSFLPYAKALFEALNELDSQIEFVAMVVDPNGETLPSWAITTDKLSDLPRASQILDKYSANANHLRWALKSQVILYCIKQGAEAVFWVDPDIMFFQSPAFLFDSLEPSQVVLSPHYRAFHSSADPINFRKNFTEGLFQAGFIGFGNKTEPVLDWWAESCLWQMDKNATSGLYVDQRFLDLLPVMWKDTTILRHRGCNLAEWNRHESQRVLVENEVRINGHDPVIFIHFTDETIGEILTGRDAILRPFLDAYLARMTRMDPTFRPRLPPALIDHQQATASGRFRPVAICKAMLRAVRKAISDKR